MKTQKRRRVAGWLAVGTSIVVTSFWAFWGIVENFHEGWYYRTVAANVGLMLVQYLSPMLIFLALTVAAIFWPRLGGALHFLLALLAFGFLGAYRNPALLLLILPLVGLGALYWFGRPSPRRLAAALALGLPMLTLIIAGVEPAVRVARRVDDGNRQARLVEGNAVALVWAPAGAGWSAAGGDWYEAQRVCQHLGADGSSREGEPQDFWRLPTVDEAVRSMARHGQNSGGVWDAESALAVYAQRPDKESPLWDTHSQVIYWWTATEADDDHAYMIAYDGRVWPRTKTLRQDYLGFRCVRR